MGPTASGKTDLAEGLAERFDAVLINADAFQVYRGMDIGTAKPVRKDLYKLIDIRDPNEPFGVGEWVQLAAEELKLAWDAGKNAIIVGGTGLYVRALMEEYVAMQGPPDPSLRSELTAKLERNGLPALVDELKLLSEEEYERIDRANPARVIRAIERLKSSPETVHVKLPHYRRMKFAIDVPVSVLNERIENRVHQMVQNGWSLEIAGLRKQGYRPTDLGFRAIGYRAMWHASDGDIGEDEAIASTIVETKRYAKRQRTWLRSEPNLLWLSSGPRDDLLIQASNMLAFDLT